MPRFPHRFTLVTGSLVQWLRRDSAKTYLPWSMATPISTHVFSCLPAHRNPLISPTSLGTSMTQAGSILPSERNHSSPTFQESEPWLSKCSRENTVQDGSGFLSSLIFAKSGRAQLAEILGGTSPKRLEQFRNAYTGKIGNRRQPCCSPPRAMMFFPLLRSTGGLLFPVAPWGGLCPRSSADRASPIDFLYHRILKQRPTPDLRLFTPHSVT